MKQIYKHRFRMHIVRNVNEVQKQEQQQSFNIKIAVAITKITGTMACAYFFAFLALLGFPILTTVWGPIVAIYIVWISQTFVQLVMLPILSVGQNVLSRHSEIMAEEQFSFTQKSHDHITQIMEHLSKQDEELIGQTAELVSQTKKIDFIVQALHA